MLSVWQSLILRETRGRKLPGLNRRFLFRQRPRPAHRQFVDDGGHHHHQFAVPKVVVAHLPLPHKPHAPVQVGHFFSPFRRDLFQVFARRFFGDAPIAGQSRFSPCRWTSADLPGRCRRAIFFGFNPVHAPRRRVDVSNQFTRRGGPEVKKGRSGAIRGDSAVLSRAVSCANLPMNKKSSRIPP